MLDMLVSTDWAPTWRPETKRSKQTAELEKNLSLVSFEGVNSSFKELRNIKIVFFF